VKLRFTSKEKELLVKELTERLKDVVYMTAEEHVRGLISYLDKEDVEWRGNDRVTIEFNVEMSIYDLLQIIGRKRRKEAGRI